MDQVTLPVENRKESRICPRKFINAKEAPAVFSLSGFVLATRAKRKSASVCLEAWHPYC
jgi:hypothetical protein